VLEREPPARDNPLLALSQPQRLLITPHIAGLSLQSRRRLVVEVGRNVAAFLTGELRNPVSVSSSHDRGFGL